ncbi:MAG: hypothetical protein ACOVRB_07155 [Akkermansiaceae bacterium]|jgi:hypothetical protein
MKTTFDHMFRDLHDVQRSQAELAAEIERLKQEPELIKKRLTERANTLPPSDIVTRSQREKEFDQTVSKGEISNKRKALARHAWLTVLLLITMVVLLWWAYRELMRLGLV